jgi:hypothetical protein
MTGLANLTGLDTLDQLTPLRNKGPGNDEDRIV